MIPDTFTCSHCGAEYPNTERITFGGQSYCNSCFTEQTHICSHCGDRIYRADNAGSNTMPLCQDCYDDYYTNCEDCGRLLHRDDANYDNGDYYCDRCYEQRCGSDIHDYYYKPTPFFYGDGNRYFGVELEIDEGGECSSSAESLLDIANCNGLQHIYCKHDGSLDDGFEVVTHPMTLDYHLREMPWLRVMNEAISMGYLSHTAGTCGLHIHVNRSAFGNTESAQDAVIARILYFFEKHWEELLKFSRRTQRQLDQWATRYGLKEHPNDILKHAKGGGGGRYTCVNLTNENTIEFRMFRGTLRYNTLIATLQLVDRVCDVALSLSDSALKDLSWTTFAVGCTQPELVQYLKERRLYVNEPVVAAEEV